MNNRFVSRALDTRALQINYWGGFSLINARVNLL